MTAAWLDGAPALPQGCVMTPAARLAAAIEILAGLANSAMPADRYIREFFRARRYAGSKDRAAVAERVFTVFRHRAKFAWRMESEAPRALVAASMAAEGLPCEDICALFSGEAHAPKPLSDREIAALQRPVVPVMPDWVRGEYPDFLDGDLRARFGAALFDELGAMAGRAPVDLRVNTLKASRDELLASLRNSGFDAAITAYSPLGLRLPAGANGLERHPLFEQGAFEFQDEAAQIASLLCDARPGMRVCDLAAGAGGKALALAAAMRNQGEIIASDIAATRLAQIGPRAARAGATIIRTALSPRGEFERVLVDAPCSGSGTWRRQPEQKWRLTPARLAELNAIQDRLLERAAALAAAGGRLVYATCSVLPCENEARIAAFLARNPGFAVLEARAIWHEALGTGAPSGVAEFFRASPLATGTDGFFTAILARG